MKLVFHPGASEELHQALAYCQNQAGATVAQHFLQQVERGIQLLQAHPLLGRPTQQGRRSLSLRHFPYSLIYRAQEDCLIILAPRHHHRRPGFGQGRRAPLTP
ncbi:type II toxin-antitoxin system RelE/ParE family toxin [Massilia sp. W12]|uniref:type II toxin-antitoxin system RelE/ParE family toxin n=1 Tax=Massilia sp. W12 TaxID=3126507 RepID=UPI0030D18F63